MGWMQGAGITLLALSNAAVVAFLAWVVYLLVRAGVRSALDDHFRKQQWYEQTGRWYSGRPPKGLPGANELTKRELKHLPKNEQPE